jgi:hypothetical protein
LTNCDRYNALKPAIVDPIVESWTGIKEAAPQRYTGAIDPTPYIGVYESNMQRFEVFSLNGGLAMRKRAKMDVYDNFSAKGDTPPATPLHPVGEDVFEAEAELPGRSNSEVRFVQPDRNGYMQFLASGARLLVRTK